MDAPQAIYEDVNRFDDFKIKQNVSDGIDILYATRSLDFDIVQRLEATSLAIWDKRRDIYITENMRGVREVQIIFQRNFGVFIEGKMFPEDRK